MKLVIVESPNKVKSISKYLGKDYKVMASVGHIRDLAMTGKYNLGVDIESGNFEPTYEISPGKQKTIEKLKKALESADFCYLATDPDREGEAISWHLKEVLGLDPSNTKRITFEEITKYGIQKGMENPRDIDMLMVDSQETRRIMDRIIGFRTSYLVQNKLNGKSAGRVQSPVLHIICDKEKEINNFVPSKYDLTLSVDGFKEKGRVTTYKGNKLDVKTEQSAKEVLDSIGDSATVSKIEESEKEVKPRFPLTTSTLQQEASRKYKLSISTIMTTAQRLFEMGEITYHRTDSIKLSPIFINAAKAFIEQEYGIDYVGKAYVQQASAGVQGAHEAIRPTDVELTPDKFEEKHKGEYKATEIKILSKVYGLIYVRAIASIMKSKLETIHEYTLDSNDYGIKVNNVEVKFDGYDKLENLLAKKKDSYKDPGLNIGDLVAVSDKTYDAEKIYRYTEGELVKKMEEVGVGRPSTYVSIITNLKKHFYIVEKDSRIKPTQIGMKVSEKLKEYLANTTDIKYTAMMEENLDDIANKSKEKLDILREMNSSFEKEFIPALNEMPVDKLIPTGETCPNCGKPLVYRVGPKGEFIACVDFSCGYIKQDEIVITDKTKFCPDCGAPLVKKKGKYGYFYGCSNFPKCHHMEPVSKKKSTKKKM